MPDSGEFYFRLALDGLNNGAHYSSSDGRGGSEQDPIKIIAGKYKLSLDIQLDSLPPKCEIWHLNKTIGPSEVFQRDVAFHQYPSHEHRGNVIVTSKEGPESSGTFKGDALKDREGVVELGTYNFPHGQSKILILLNFHVQYLKSWYKDYTGMEDLDLTYHVAVAP